MSPTSHRSSPSSPVAIARRALLPLAGSVLVVASCSSNSSHSVGDPTPGTTGDVTNTSEVTSGGTTTAASSSMGTTTTAGTAATVGGVTSDSTSSSTTVGTMGSTNTSSISGGGAGGSTSTMSSTSDGPGGGAGGSTTDGSGGGGGGLVPAQPSSGCGNMNPQVGSAQSPLTVSGHQYYVKLPNNYDATTPYIALFMFNPTGNPIDWAEKNAGFEQNGAAEGAIRIYPHPANSSAGWGSGDVSFFEPLYNNIVADYCVDQARMFAAGESSGGDFSSILGCEFADKLRGVAPCSTKPVNGYPLNVSQRSCTGQVTAVVIHGLNDNVVGPENGPLTRDFYTELNHCSDMSEPVDGYTDSLSNCVEYQGCDEGYPVFWCQHQDPEYSGTNHGWPHFAADMLWDLFSSY